MTFPVEAAGRALSALSLCIVLAGCAVAGDRHQLIVPSPLNGPASDYPMVLGEPYEIGAVLYTPADIMNYDEVGYAVADGEAAGVTAAHHTLPLPSYVEVTALDSGHTILVRVERRGPMNGPQLVALSPAAFEKLGAAPGAPVRVRRVNPPEEERALLRTGEHAAARLDTPLALAAVLKKKLPLAAALPSTAREAAPPLPMAKPEPDLSSEPVSARFNEMFVREAPPPEHAAAITIERRLVVQAAAFSTKERANNAAHALGGTVSPAGKFFRVRTGPFATRVEAEASLAKVRAAGYTDARIYDDN